MCTLLLASRIVPGHRLVVVANRDEELTRPSSPPFRWTDGFFAPRDDLAGGTWLGLNEHGVFVGVTNRFLGPRDATRRSRGELVVEALRETSARAIHSRLASLDGTQYNGFHLVYADAHDVLATVSDGTATAQLALGEGLIVATERAFGASADGARRAARVVRAFESWRGLHENAVAPDLLSATRLLTEHDATDPLAATCIHLDDARYGTRSSMVLGVTEAGASSMFWAEGPPCRTPFRRLM